jgi:hypothetical protein
MGLMEIAQQPVYCLWRVHQNKLGGGGGGGWNVWGFFWVNFKLKGTKIYFKN